jgi:uncharacterized protein (TIGR02466 family)
MNQNNQLQVGYYFPTAIGICTDLLDVDQISDLHNLCTDIHQQTGDSINHNWVSGASSPYNTMTTHNIADDSRFDLLNQAVSIKVKEFALHHADAGTYVSDHAWLNIYTGSQYQEPHTHSMPYIYSAVFYIQATDDSGLFVAQAPHVHAQIESNHVGSNLLTDEKRWFQPSTNMLIIFKSSLSHYTTPNRSDSADRMSVAYNFRSI